MSAPRSDESGVRQVIRALRAAGYVLDYVNDGEEEIPVSTTSSAVDAVMAVDMAHVFFRTSEGERAGWVWFVLGNDPEEVAADYTLTLSHVLDPLTEGWWD